MRRAVYPGSFDPAHFGHIDIATRAARMFEELYIAVYHRPQKRVLFNVEERVGMLRNALNNLPNVTVVPYDGLTVDYMRKVSSTIMIRGLRVFSDFELEFRMALANRRLAPEIEVVTFISDERHLHLSSSTVREVASLGGEVSSMVPPEIEAALMAKFAEQNRNGTAHDYVISLPD
jgi:pantetheine-phosphate adenylyltransferase